MMEKNAYDEAISTGRYEHPSGLIGKYDNVRRLWEDEVTGMLLSPYLESLVAEGNKLRVLDLGCGSGDGYDLLLGIRRQNVTTSEHCVNVINPDNLDAYLGLDINPSLVAQANAIHNASPGVVFEEMDFNHLPSRFVEEPAYDLYFAGYGTLSHNTDEETVRLLSRIAKHCRDGSIILCDWLGRYCYEWQPLWTKDMEENKTIDYLISYIYADGQESEKEITSFPLRLLSSEETLAIVEESSRAAEVQIEPAELFDRSIFMGRHIDTAQYNPNCKPVRRTLNSLLEPNIRTNLDDLIVEYVPKEGFPELNDFYHNLETCWNDLVRYTMELLPHFDAAELSRSLAVGGEALDVPSFLRRPERVPASSLENPSQASTAVTAEPALKKAMLEMERVVSGASSLDIADPRADIIEPQLCYCLRQLEMDLQRGEGCGHGLVAVLKVHK
jgi:SAM-dependent methyltransferase